MTYWIEALGVAAAICSMSSFIPQLYKIWRTRDASSVSLKMFALTVTGFVLWTAYGVVRGGWPIVLSNLVCLVLSALILWSKWQFRASETPSQQALLSAHGFASSGADKMGASGALDALVGQDPFEPGATIENRADQ